MFGKYSITVAWLLVAASTQSGAGQSDVIRGRVVGPEGVGVSRATIEATGVLSKVSRGARTDADGKFTLVMTSDDGDYLVTVTALGFQPRRVQVKRVGDDDVLVADVSLSRVPVALGAVAIRAPRPRPGRNDSALDASGTEHVLRPGILSLSEYGDLTASAISLLGAQLTSSADSSLSGFSVFGLPPEQNALALSGLPLAAATLPRDAPITATLVTTPYDVSRGAFAGGQIQVRTRPGSNIVSRTSSSVFDSPRAQWFGGTTRSDQEFSQVSLSGLASGAIVPDKVLYGLSYEGRRRSSPHRTLIDIDAPGLRELGLASDSVRRFVRVLEDAHLPSVGSRARVDERLSVLGTLDLNSPTPTSGHALTANVVLNLVRSNGATAAATELPTRGSGTSRSNRTIQLRHSNYFGLGLLTETSASAAVTTYDVTPYVRAPAANVRIASTFLEETPAVQVIAAGGAQTARRDRSGVIAFRNQVSWFTADSRHRFKLTAEFQRETSRQYVSTNELGTVTYMSLHDLEHGRPASFTRSLGAHRRSESHFVGSLSLADSYRPRKGLQFQYGIRVDGSRFSTPPAANSLLKEALGADNTALPGGIYVSPRVGFTWTLPDAVLPGGTRGSLHPRPVVRGGVGVFQSLPGNSDAFPTLDHTGLPDGVGQLSCIGPATPVVDWARMASNQEIPATCADGSLGSAFASRAPSVILFDRGFTPPRSLRSNLQWNGVIAGGRLFVVGDAAISFNESQSGIVDLNFSGRSIFALHSEANRPVFVAPTSIVPNSGLIASGDARISPRFAHVSMRGSGFRSISRQISVSVQPFVSRSTFAWGAGYAYARTGEMTSGFTATAGNPLTPEWSRSSFDARHQVQYSLSYDVRSVARIAWYGSLRSGRPYTPFVAGDINGDGYANDRAFVFSPGATGDSVLGGNMRMLMENAPRGARQCLRRQQGQVAKRNSCEGPWASSAMITAHLNTTGIGVSRRANVALQLANPLGAVDLMLHGSSRLHGWGQAVSPSHHLLFVRGFDPDSRTFKYEVNTRFGSPTAQTKPRTPVTLSLLVRMDWAPAYERQLLTRELDQGRRSQGPRRDAAALKAIFGPRTVPNPMAMLLAQADSLALSDRQADSLAAMQRTFVLQLDSIWTRVARDLASLPTRYDHDAAYRQYQAAWARSIERLMVLARPIRDLLSPQQRHGLASDVSRLLDDRYVKSLRSGR